MGDETGTIYGGIHNPITHTTSASDTQIEQFAQLPHMRIPAAINALQNGASLSEAINIAMTGKFDGGGPIDSYSPLRQPAGAGNVPTQSRVSGNGAVTEFVDGVTVVDRRTGKTFSGTVDLRPTLHRIANGISHPHRNDGSTFRNKKGLLPAQPDGYYKEFVHPTPGVNGPGPQRIVQGRQGELYYTPNHYNSFIPLN